MDSIPKKALFLAVVTCLALTLIGVGITYYNKTQPVLENSSSKIDSVATQLDSIEYKQYEGMPVSGSEVISAINTKASSNIAVKVKTSGNPSGKVYNSGSYNIKDINGENYIEPTANFNAEVDRTDNGTVTGLTFEQD